MTLYLRDDHVTECPCGEGCSDDSLTPREPLRIEEGRVVSDPVPVVQHHQERPA